MITKHSVICSDKTPIVTTLYDSATPKGTIIIASAIGVKQDYYARLAVFLSENSFNVITFDYRATGESQSEKNGVALCSQLSDWGEKDIEAVIEFSEGRGLPVYFIGHSIGGQILGLSKSAVNLKKIIFIASSAPYWRRWAFPDNIKILLTANVVFPFISYIRSDFPTKSLGLGNQNIPSTLIRQWAKWMSASDYLFSEKFNLNLSGYQEITQDLLSIGFTDDNLAPENNIRELLSFFPNSNSDVKLIDPKEVNASKIGHVGFFNDKFKHNLWEDILLWLKQENN